MPVRIDRKQTDMNGLPGLVERLIGCDGQSRSGLIREFKRKPGFLAERTARHCGRDISALIRRIQWQVKGSGGIAFRVGSDFPLNVGIFLVAELKHQVDGEIRIGTVSQRIFYMKAYRILTARRNSLCCCKAYPKTIRHDLTKLDGSAGRCYVSLAFRFKGILQAIPTKM